MCNIIIVLYCIEYFFRRLQNINLLCEINVVRNIGNHGFLDFFRNNIRIKRLQI